MGSESEPPPAPIVAEEGMLSPLNGSKIDRAAIVARASRNDVLFDGASREHQHKTFTPDGRVMIAWSETSTTTINGRTYTAADCEDPACPMRR